MKLRLEATPSELVEKSEDLVRELSGQLAPYAPDVADILEKAFPHEEPEGEMRYPVLEALRQQTAKLYQDHLAGMLEEIGAVLDSGLHKSEEEMEAWIEGADEMEKAGGPYIGPRGGKWADPEHTIPWKEHEAHPDGFTPPTERYTDEEARDQLEAWGERLYGDQVMDPLSRDETGFSRFDMDNWRRVRGNVPKMRALLGKYKRQLLGSRTHKEVELDALHEWYKLGMQDPPKAEVPKLEASYHPTFGSLTFTVTGWIDKKVFDAFYSVCQDNGVRWHGATKTYYVHKRELADFNPEKFVEAVGKLGVEVKPPAEGWRKSEVVNGQVKEPPAARGPMTAEEVRDGILAKPPKVRNKIAIVRGADGIFSIYSPFSREFNDIMSNKKGNISGIVRANPDTWARETHQLELVEEVIPKLQEAHPDWEVVTSGVKEAQIERDQRLADLQKPIPEVQAKLNPTYKLFPYQNECVRFLDQADGNALIGDEMGLGKTLQTLAWAAKNNKKVLVVCPLVVRRQWLQEAHKFFPEHFQGVELVSSDIKRGRVPDLSQVNIATVNYESLDKFAPYLKDAGFDTIVIDECFGPETLVDTPMGPRPIAQIQVGDEVYSAVGISRVRHIGRKQVDGHVVLKYSGREIRCSPCHPFFTDRGWVTAEDLTLEDRLVPYREALRLVQERDYPPESPESFLRILLCCEMADAATFDSAQDVYQRAISEIARSEHREKEPSIGQKDAGKKSNARPSRARQGIADFTRYGASAFIALRERIWPNFRRAIALCGATAGNQASLEMEPCDCSGWAPPRISDQLQSGSSIGLAQAVRRSGWLLALLSLKKGARSEERAQIAGIGLDAITVHESGSYPGNETGTYYDLQVDGHPSYVVNGILVHNSHRMKNPKAKTTKNIQQAAKAMKHRILLSGTAIKNKREELITQLELVAPEQFVEKIPTKTAYDVITGEYIPVAWKKKLKNSTIGGLWQDMRGVYLARSKHVVLKDLPPKTTTITRIEIKNLPDVDPRWSAEEKLAKLARLRGAVALGKVPATIDVVREILETSDNRVIVFSESVAATKQIAEAFGDDAILHHGTMSPPNREKAKADFQQQDEHGQFSTKKRVFATTRPSMAVGANLTAGSCVVFNDLPWTAADLRQAEDRCHRTGQAKNVNVYWVTADGNHFDESVEALLQRKYELAKKQNQGEQLTAEEVKWMNQPVRIGDIFAQLQGKEFNYGETPEGELAAEKEMEGDLDKSFTYSTTALDQERFYHEHAGDAENGRADPQSDGAGLGLGGVGSVPISVRAVQPDFRFAGTRTAPAPTGQAVGGGIAGQTETVEPGFSRPGSDREGGGAGVPGIRRATGVPGGTTWFGADSEYDGQREAGDGGAVEFGGEGWQGAPYPLSDEIELPGDLIEALFGDLFPEMEKALGQEKAGHKYIRRVPVIGSDGKRRYRYFYKVTGGMGLGHTGEFQVGARFAVRADTPIQGQTTDPEGHLEVLEAIGDMVKVQHTETGKTYLLSPKELQIILHRHHYSAIQGAREKLIQDVTAVRVHGSEKQRGRAEGQLEVFEKTFAGIKRFRYATILSREAPEKVPKGHAETRAAMDGWMLLMQTFDTSKYYDTKDDRVMTNVRVPIEMRSAAQETLKRMQALWGDTWEDTAMSRLKFYRGTDGMLIRGHLAKLAAGDAAGLVRSYHTPVGDYSKVDAYDARNMHNMFADLHYCLEMDRAKADLKLDSRGELAPEAALLLAEVKLQARRNYFEEGYGSRNGLEALQDYLGQIRTDRGVKAFITLTRGLNDKKIPSHRATIGAIECLGYNLSDILKKAEKRMEAFHAIHQGPVQNTVFRNTPELDAAIEADVKIAQGYLARGESFGDVATKSAYLHGVEKHPETIKSRFSQIARSESSVFKLFKEKFGVSIFLEDDIFDHFFEAPSVHDEDHNRVDIEKGLHCYSEEEKKAYKKVLKKLKGKDLEKAERFLARARASFGAHAMGDPEYASREDKAALAEFQLAADMSYESRVDVLKGLYNALADMKETLGDFHLSNLPMVVAQRVVGVGANAHYSSESVPEWLDAERLGSYAPENVQRERFPHIALGLGMEKSLAHELIHALDNRVTLRVTDPNRAINYATHPVINELTGSADSAIERAAVLSEPAHQLEGELIKVMGHLNGGRNYASCAALGLQELGNSELLKDEQAKKIYDAAVTGFRAQPGGEVLWKFFQAVREKTAGLERFRKADDADQKGGSVMSLLAEMGQVSADVAKRAYWANGTEILARAVEHHIFQKRLAKGECNPTLTHLNYTNRGEDDNGTYFTDSELDAIRPTLEAVLEHISGNMRKALFEELEAEGWVELAEDELEKALGAEKAGHKYIRRVPKPGGGYTYFYRESAIGRGPQEGETVRVGERHIQIKHVDEERGTVTLHDGEHDLEVKHHEWGKLLAQHYGEAYFAHAEKRAQAVVRAIAKHVPAEALHDLKGGTDAERLAELQTRVPEVYAKLAKAFQRQGLSVHQAKEVLGAVMARRGWQPEARQVVIGAVVTEGGLRVAGQIKQVMSGAENLAGEGLVEAKHAQASLELTRPQAPDATAKLEEELRKVQRLLTKALTEGDKGKLAGVLAHTMALSSEALHQAQALGIAFPGALGDKLVGATREALLQVPATAPRKAPTTEGAQTHVYVAGEGGKAQALPARYRLVEASSLKASHDPLKNFVANPDYPEGVQERAYHRDLAEQDKVRRNARELNPAFLVNTNPDAVNGPPLVTAEGLVLGGNSRTMSMQLAYHGQPEKAAELKAYLMEHAHQVGLKPEDVAALQHPVLVRALDPKERAKPELQLLVRQANESFTQAMDPRTMQVALSRRLDGQTLDGLVNGMEEGETLNAFLGSKRAQPFIQNLRRVGVIDQRNVNQFLKQSTGQLNEDGKALVSKILVGRMVDSADLLSDTPGKLLTSLAQSVPHMVQAAGYGPGYDISKSLQTAMHAYNRLQEKVEAGTLKGLDSKISDHEIHIIMRNEFEDMFGSRHAILDDPRAQEILRVLIKKPGPQQMSGVFLEYARLASQNPEGQGLLGVKPRTPDEVFRLSVEAATRKGGAAAIEKALAAEATDLVKAGGPFIGPRGGKWADPEHTIPWQEPGAGGAQPSSADPDHVPVKFHPVMLRDPKSEVTWNYRVTERKDGKVRLSRHAEHPDIGPVMPEASVKHFQNDLAGKVDLPHSGRPEIDAVIDGKAEFMGKGDDGLAFKVGDQVVKVSTTVPYQPENPGHRTPDEAVEMLQRQVEVGNKLADAGIPGIQRSEFVRHGDKGFQIKPWVEIPKKFSREQLDQIQDTVIGVHKAGYAIRDSIQAGLDVQGKPVLFDVGKAGLQGAGTGIYSDVSADMDNMRQLYRDSGEDFVRRDVNEGEQAWQRVVERLPRRIKEGKFKGARFELKMAVEKRLQIARATLKGEELKSAESTIDFERMVYEGDIEDAEKKAGETPELKKAGGPFVGPKGGLWADPQHTQHWEAEKPKEAPKAEPSAQAQPAPKEERVKWEVVSIHDTRDFDWETGKPIPGTGNAQECSRCGRLHAVIHRMRHPNTGEHREVGSGCGPQMAGGKEWIDDATMERAKTDTKKETAKKFEAKARGWLHAASKKIDEVIQADRIGNKPFFVARTPVDPSIVRSEFSKNNWETNAPEGQIRVYEDFEQTREVLASHSPFDKESTLRQAMEGSYVYGIVDQILKEIGVPEKTQWPVKLGPPFRSKDPRSAIRQIVFHTLMQRYFRDGPGWGRAGYSWVEGQVEPSLVMTQKNPRGINLEKYPILEKSLDPIPVIPMRVVKRYPVL